MEAMKISAKTHEESANSSHNGSSSSLKMENGMTHGIYAKMAKEKLNASHLAERINSTERLKKESTEHLSHLEDGPRRSTSEDAELFDTAILKDLEFAKTLNERGEISISPATSEDSLVLRALRRSDYHLEYMELLSQLTVVGAVTQDMFEKRFDSMRRAEGSYYTIVIEEKLPKRRIVGSATLVIEQKFIRATALRGRVEDVVVHRDRRGQDLGKLLMEVATVLSKSLGCYKVSLECKDRLVEFYSQFGYQVDPGNNYMMQRFHE
ncbi:hypothetical protein RvY_07106 [Ramazzottius varieornatus]|uniref:Glucosamine 6-phosphate N-acetyltransferase n=1 Tax=Ramazzottius varieornatus TaxID=947166 RepID=A0A1D1V0X5_RAMVA|nr:hypothetical protein RvY_07106 [Ramazzottius varieornatus]